METQAKQKYSVARELAENPWGNTRSKLNSRVRLTANQVNLFVILALLGMFTSCNDDFLYINNPNAVTTESFYKTEQQAVMATNAAYTSLQKGGLYGRLFPFSQIGRSDEGYPTVWILGSGEINQAVYFNTISTNIAVRDHWRDCYNGIFRCNVALEKIPAIPMNEELKTRLLGEAKFLRAFYYFHLVTTFGEEIPLIVKTPKSSDDYYTPSASPGAIWDHITTDLDSAKVMLWSQETLRSAQELGRASSGAAAAMLGKVYLYRATKDERVINGTLSASSLYSKAKSELLSVVNGDYGMYKLMQGPHGYRNNFLEYDVADGNTLVEYNDESIFEIGFANQTGGFFVQVDGDGATASEGFGYSQEFGIGRGAGSGRWHNMGATKTIHGEFEPEDPRRILTFWTPDGAKYVNSAGREFTYNDIIDWLDPQGAPVYYGWRKYEYDKEFRSNCVSNYSPINYRYMRYSDVLLMLAESIIKTSSDPLEFNSEAAYYIDIVRDRARGQDVSNANGFVNANNLSTTEELYNKLPYALPNGRMITNMMEILMHERAVELAGECHRWTDIVRWGIGSDVLVGVPNKESFRGEIDYLYPIPQSELDTNPNIKPNARN